MRYIIGKMDKNRYLKFIDAAIGTPLCHLLGFFSGDSTTVSPPDPATVKKILTIKTVAIGDLVVALPTFKALREAYPQAKIVLLTTPRVREVVDGCPFLDEIIYFDITGRDRGLGGWLRLLRKLRAANFDLVIDMEHYYRFTTLLAYLSRAPVRVGFDLPRQGRQRLFTVRVPYPIDKHEVEAFLELAGAVGGRVEKPRLVEVAVSSDDRRIVDDWLTEHDIKAKDLTVGIHAGTSPVALARRWPPERFAALADTLVERWSARIIFTGAPEDRDLIDVIRGQMRQRALSTAGDFTLKQFAELSRRFDLFISLDTGPMHIAAAMGAKVIGLFGPNTPVKWGPYGDGNSVIYKGFECSPCTKQYLGQVSDCAKGDCMSAISLQDVVVAAEAALNADVNNRQGA